MAGIVEDPILALCPGVAVVRPGTTVRLCTDGATLALLHDPLTVRTVQGGAERLLVGALHVAVRTLTLVTPPGAPDLAVAQHWGQLVQGSAGLCNYFLNLF